MIAEHGEASSALKGCCERLLAEGRWTNAITDPTSVGSSFGTRPQRTLELVGHGVRIAEPRARLVRSAVRPYRFGFAFANSLWSVTGSSRPDEITPYNPRGAAFVTDDRELTCALGPRLAGGGNALLPRAIALLREMPSTRRALIPLFWPSDLADLPRDTPCPASVQFLIRDDRLQTVCTMRSQSLVGLLVYDLTLMTMLQEFVAVELGCEVGQYTHFCGSLHVYETELTRLQQVAEEVSIALPPMDKMPTSPLTDHRIADAEYELRTAGARADSYRSAHDMLPKYWQQILDLMTLDTAEAASDPDLTCEVRARIVEPFRSVI